MLTRRRALGLLAVTPAAAALLPSVALAREPDVFQNPIAINAIDPVAYFEQQTPVPGQAAHARRWNGAEWHFANENNANMFGANPEAFAASRGYLAPTIPEAWTIYEGKLYLNASLRAQELWLRDVPGNIAAGLGNWPGILG